MDSSKYLTLKQHNKKHNPKFFPDDVQPLSVDWKNGNQPAMWEFSDRGQAVGSCVRCENPPCIEYSDSELAVPAFPQFPADLSRDVCPSNAITWPADSEAPQIDTNLCMSCGLCVSRCPVSAISFGAELHAEVNDIPNAYFRAEAENGVSAFDAPTLQMFNPTPFTGHFLGESDNAISEIMSRLKLIASNEAAQFPNHLARNLLLAVGNRCAMRRLGDTNIRMDLVLSTASEEQGTSEVEFGLDVLDAPRNILDNAAVLIARYNADKKALVPLIVSLSLPNRRSEYWQVVNDISRVLEINIQSVTFGVLMVLVWNGIKINFSEEPNFYTDTETPSVQSRVEKLIGRHLNLSEGHEGLMQSQK